MPLELELVMQVGQLYKVLFLLIHLKHTSIHKSRFCDSRPLTKVAL